MPLPSGPQVKGKRQKFKGKSAKAKVQWQKFKGKSDRTHDSKPTLNFELFFFEL